MTPHDGTSPTHDRGQATIEMALVLPLLALWCYLLVIVGTTVRDRIDLQAAARDAARAASVALPADRLAAARTVAERTSHLQHLEVVVTTDSSMVNVSVSYREPRRPPLFVEVTLRATAAMPLESV